MTTKPTTNEAIALACNLVVQAQGDVSKARRAIDAAHAYLCKMDDTYKPEPNEALETVAAAYSALPQWMIADGYDSPAMLPQAVRALIDLSTLTGRTSDTVQTPNVEIAAATAYAADQELRAENAEAELNTLRERFATLQDLYIEANARVATMALPVVDPISLVDASQAAPVEADDAEITTTDDDKKAKQKSYRDAYRAKRKAEAAPVEAPVVVEPIAEVVAPVVAAPAQIDDAAFAHLPPKMRQWAIDKARADAANAAQ